MPPAMTSHFRRLRTLAVLPLLLTATPLLPGCATATYSYSKEPDPRKSEIVIGVSDVVRVTVWKNAELSGDATVRGDGVITLPLLGDLPAAGHTPSELQKMVLERVARYVKGESAPVTVALTAWNSYRYTLTGNFERSGVYTSRTYVTVSEAIATAGGLNRFANGHKLVLRRGEDKDMRRIPIDFYRVSSGEHPDEDLCLMAGDVLFAP